MNVFGNNFSVDYRRLMPSASQDTDDGMDYGIYEDEESHQDRLPSNGNNSAADDSNNPILRCLEAFAAMMPQLSLRERMLGCATCMVCGYILSFGSFLRFRSLITGDPVPIVVHVTIGNILALCGTCFLTGPTSQVRRMWHQSRRGASIMYLSSMWITIILLFLPKFVMRGFLLFLLIIIQYIAITWYCLSYIPFGREMLKRFCVRLVSSGEGSG
uniref:Vesicle transport protein n=1 Tax=Craspedostauros australis TaxID=1486917 RepID=A0A6T6H7X9_9STRA|mmetsp:Transcript_3430/g.9099  ORF Transcript_3430/g.9099 Transcript_3430/m.9099 type:complete len:215 (+) Transcript_3430:188-832(+)